VQKYFLIAALVSGLLIGAIPTYFYYSSKLEKQEADAVIASQELEKKLNVDKAKADFDKAFAVASAQSKLQSVIDGLRNRPVRPATVASTQPSCTGAGLYRDDSEFLARLASEADQIRIERDYYYGRYEAARKLLAGQKLDDGLNGTVHNPKSVP
jgi:hypothetical protein